MNNYFSHDSNARNDEKLIRLRMKHKAAGYGVYFMILERMRDEEDYMCARDYDMIAFDLREDVGLIKSVVEDFDLFCFTDDEKYFYSPSFMKRMDKKGGLSKSRSESGRKGAAARWQKDTTENAAIEDKGEERKETMSSPPVQEDKLDKEKEALTHDREWFESIAMRYHITLNKFFESIDLFFLDCRARGKLSHNNLKDAKSHFADWLRINLKQQQNNGINNNNPTTKEQRAEAYAARIQQLSAEDRAEQMENH